MVFGLANLVFIVHAILFIERAWCKPLLIFGLTGIALCMFILSYEFDKATYTLQPETVVELPEAINQQQISPMVGVTYEDDLSFKEALANTLGEDLAQSYESQLITQATDINATLILIGIIGFVVPERNGNHWKSWKYFWLSSLACITFYPR